MKLPRFLIVFLVSLFLSLMGHSALAHESGGETGNLPSVAEIVAAHPDLGTLRKALRITGFDAVLDNHQSLTFFAPHNAAFDEWPSQDLGDLMRNKAALTTFLEFHVAESLISAEAAKSMDYAVMMTGGLVSFAFEDGEVYVNDAKFVIRDIPARNGVVHVIGRLLEP